MLIIRSIPDNPPGEWCDRTLFGARIRVKIRPRNDDVSRRIRERHKRTVNGQETFDEQAIMDDLYDYLVEDFTGIGGEEGPWPVDLAHKKRLLFMEVPLGEQPIYTWATARSLDLGVTVSEDERKN